MVEHSRDDLHEEDTDPVNYTTINSTAIRNGLDPETLARVVQYIYEEATNRLREYVENGDVLLRQGGRIAVTTAEGEWDAIVEHFEMPYHNGEKIEVDEPQDYYEGAGETFRMQTKVLGSVAGGRDRIDDALDENDVMIFPAHDCKNYDIDPVV